MKFETSKQGIDYARLTYEEEQFLAQSIMDAMMLPCAHGPFLLVLSRIYEYKTRYGNKITVSDLDLLLEWYDLQQIEFPNLDEDGRHMEYPFGAHPNIRDFLYRSKIIQAWKEIWMVHPIRTEVLAMEDFPGDHYLRRFVEQTKYTSDDWLERQREIEHNFRIEVNRVQQEFDCSEHQACLIVADYMPRGDFSPE